MPVSVRIQEAQQFALSNRLKQLGRGDLQKKVRDRIKAAGAPVVEEVRQAWMDIPSTSHGGGAKARRAANVGRASTERSKAAAARRGAGLRETGARATKLEVQARGIRIVTKKAPFPQDQQRLPHHLNSEKGWQHPVFGDRAVWVHQAGHPFFDVTLKKHAAEFRHAVDEAIADVIRQFERG